MPRGRAVDLAGRSRRVADNAAGAGGSAGGASRFAELRDEEHGDCATRDMLDRTTCAAFSHLHRVAISNGCYRTMKRLAVGCSSRWAVRTRGRRTAQPGPRAGGDDHGRRSASDDRRSVVGQARRPRADDGRRQGDARVPDRSVAAARLRAWCGGRLGTAVRPGRNESVDAEGADVPQGRQVGEPRVVGSVHRGRRDAERARRDRQRRCVRRLRHQALERLGRLQGADLGRVLDVDTDPTGSGRLRHRLFAGRWSRCDRAQRQRRRAIIIRTMPSPVIRGKSSRRCGRAGSTAAPPANRGSLSAAGSPTPRPWWRWQANA